MVSQGVQGGLTKACLIDTCLISRRLSYEKSFGRGLRNKHYRYLRSQCIGDRVLQPTLSQARVEEHGPPCNSEVSSRVFCQMHGRKPGLGRLARQQAASSNCFCFLVMINISSICSKTIAPPYFQKIKQVLQMYCYPYWLSAWSILDYVARLGLAERSLCPSRATLNICGD